MNTNLDYKTKILTYLQDRFKDNLIAVVLFGSRSRQTERAFSDFDLLIIANDLPAEHRKRRQVAASIRRELALLIDATVLGPEAFVASVQNCAPLMIELACANEIWFDRNEFFSRNISLIHSIIQTGKLIQLQPGVWKLSEDFNEMATDGLLVPA